MILPLISCISGLAFDALAVYQMLAFKETLPGLLLHITATLAALPGMVALVPPAVREARLPLLMLCLGFAATAPIVGILSILYFSVLSRRAIPVHEEDLPYIFATQLEAATNQSGREMESVNKSVVDLLHSQDTLARRNAILAMKGVDPRLSIPILRKGLQDSDEQVRIYAQNNLARIIEQQEQSIKRVEANLERTPEDPAAMVHLAEQYHELVYLRLVVDEEGCLSYMNKAAALLDRSLQIDPENQQALFLLMKCCIRKNELQKAEICAAKLRELGMQEEILIPWVMEIQFSSKKWEELKSTFKSFRNARYTNPKIESLAELWIGNPSAAT